jgi:hypothetical protein
VFVLLEHNTQFSGLFIAPDENKNSYQTAQGIFIQYVGSDFILTEVVSALKGTECTATVADLIGQ